VDAQCNLAESTFPDEFHELVILECRGRELVVLLYVRLDELDQSIPLLKDCLVNFCRAINILPGTVNNLYSASTTAYMACTALIDNVVAASRVPLGTARLQMLVARLRVLATRRQLLVRLVRVHQLLLLQVGAVYLDGHGQGVPSAVLRPRLPLSLGVEGWKILAMLQRGLLDLLLALLVVMRLEHGLIVAGAVWLLGAHHSSLLLLLLRYIVLGDMSLLRGLLACRRESTVGRGLGGARDDRGVVVD
jgi:hypothetical protein